MPRLWNETIEAHRHEVREAILNTTAELVTENGLLGVSMSEIAARTGIGRATLYKYFPDVEAILLAWHERQITGHLEHLSEVRDRHEDPKERLGAVLEAFAHIQHERVQGHPHHDHGHEHDHGGAEMAAFLHHHDLVAEAQGQVHDLIRGVITAAAEASHVRDDVPRDELADYCIHALAAAGRLHSKAAVDRLVAIILDGLQPPVSTMT